MLGENLRAFIRRTGMTQDEVAKKSRVSAGYLSKIIKGKIKNPSHTRLQRIANVLGITVNQLTGTDSRLRAEDPEELLNRLRLAQPVKVPVYTDYPVHAGILNEPIDYVYLPKPDFAGRNIEGYIISGACLEPDIQDGDTIIVDRDASIEIGNIVICLVETMIHIGKIRQIADTTWVENKDNRFPIEQCQVMAKVILSGNWKRH